MTLLEAIKSLAALDQESTIYAAEPWTDASTVVVEREPKGGTTASADGEHGLKYFLEVFIARDFIEDWSAGLDTEPTLQETCARLIQCATRDA